MNEQAIDYWGKAGDQALRRSAFQEAIAHLGKAIEMADNAGGAPTRDAGGAPSAGQRAKLQTGYAQAMAWTRGYSAEETVAAVARAQELAGSVNDGVDHFDALYGQWVASSMAGDLGQAAEIAGIYLKDARSQGRPPETGAAERMSGFVHLLQGEFRVARAHFEAALSQYNPEWDSAVKQRHGADYGIVINAQLALVAWQFGEVQQARGLFERAMARAVESGHVPTVVVTRAFKLLLEGFRGNAGATQREAETTIEIAQANGLALYLAFGSVFRGWANARLGAREAGVAELRDALAKMAEMGQRTYTPFFQACLAELEADGPDIAGALARIEEALALARETGERWTDALLHRIRGDILLKADSENPARAEEAYLAAVAVAREQGARSFGLQAALPLAKLYQSTSRAVDAHDVLAPAPEGFAPTPEMPEIAEAQALLAALAEADEVKNAAASRQRRLQLQTSYGQALMLSRGYGSGEEGRLRPRSRIRHGGR